MPRRSLKLTTADLWNNSRTKLHNWRRRSPVAPAEYVALTLAGELPEYIPPPPSWQRWLPFQLPGGPSGPSLSGVRSGFEQIAFDGRPTGVLLNLNVTIGWATAQSLRDAMNRLRDKGKQIVVYATNYDVIQYYVATAADKILAPRPAIWDVSGLRSELTFLKDSLTFLGVQAEVVNVSPYKTAWDTYARSEISPEHKAMIEWTMDGRFETLVEAIAKARKLDSEQVRDLIDQAPLTAAAAHEHGLLDAVLYEDEIAEYLAPEKKEEKKKPARWWPFGKKETAEEKPEKPKANIKRWGAVAGSLRRQPRWRSGKRLAIISVEGTIIPGRSPQTPPIPTLPIPIPIPFIGEPMAGSETVSQHLRDAEKDESIAAIVLNVNSRGGSALASDLIWREVDRVRRKKPIVVYMGDFAASGGYFVSASANHIIAQPLTLTGSIGVITLKIVTTGLYEKLKANRVVLQRGAHAGLYADDAPFTPELRAAAQAQTDAYYADFKNVVTSGRHIEDSNFEDIAGGRVWLGVQALERKLVDELGDLQVAIDKAKELAKLPSDRYTPNVWYSGSGGSLFPPPFPSAVDSIAEYANLMRTVFRERVWMMMPFKID